MPPVASSRSGRPGDSKREREGERDSESDREGEGERGGGREEDIVRKTVKARRERAKGVQEKERERDRGTEGERVQGRQGRKVGVKEVGRGVGREGWSGSDLNKRVVDVLERVILDKSRLWRTALRIWKCRTRNAPLYPVRPPPINLAVCVCVCVCVCVTTNQYTLIKGADPLLMHVLILLKPPCVYELCVCVCVCVCVYVCVCVTTVTGHQRSRVGMCECVLLECC